jgi:hypothetical protein
VNLFVQGNCLFSEPLPAGDLLTVILLYPVDHIISADAVSIGSKKGDGAKEKYFDFTHKKVDIPAMDVVNVNCVQILYTLQQAMRETVVLRRRRYPTI